MHPNVFYIMGQPLCILGQRTREHVNVDSVSTSTTASQPLVFNETRDVLVLPTVTLCSTLRPTLQPCTRLTELVADITTGQSDMSKAVCANNVSLTKIIETVLER